MTLVATSRTGILGRSSGSEIFQDLRHLPMLTKNGFNSKNKYMAKKKKTLDKASRDGFAVVHVLSLANFAVFAF